MAKQRPSTQKRQREFQKQQRELKKAERAAQKRERRQSREEPGGAAPAEVALNSDEEASGPGE